MRQTTHSTCLAARGLLKVRKDLTYFISCHLLLLAGGVTKFVHAQIPCLIFAVFAKIDQYDFTILASDARPITVISCADCKTPRFGIQNTSLWWTLQLQQRSIFFRFLLNSILLNNENTIRERLLQPLDGSAMGICSTKPTEPLQHDLCLMKWNSYIRTRC